MYMHIVHRFMSAYNSPVYIHVYVCVYTHIYTHTHTYTHTHIHTCTHTHKHTHTLSLSFSLSLSLSPSLSLSCTPARCLAEGRASLQVQSFRRPQVCRQPLGVPKGFLPSLTPKLLSAQYLPLKAPSCVWPGLSKTLPGAAVLSVLMKQTALSLPCIPKSQSSI